MNNPDPHHLMESQVRECFGRVIYTHKTHSKMADTCAETLRQLKLAQIWLSSLTASGVMVTIFADELWLKIGTGVVSLLTVAINSYMKGFDPGATAQKHRDTASAVWPIRESYLSLLTDIRARVSPIEEIRTRRDELQDQLASIYHGAPHTTANAYAAAQTALQKDEEYTFTDQEIDAFLPPDLRRNS